MLENHFSAGDASLEEKERALYADAAPGDKNLLLHYPDGREAESLEQPPAGAPSTANGQGSESEASLSNSSAAESAPPGDVEGPGEEEEGPHAAGTLPPGGAEGPEEGRPEFSSGEEAGQEEAGVGLPTEGAANMEAEVQEGSGGVPEELQGRLGDGPMEEEAAGAAESVAPQSIEGEEAGGEGSTGSGHQSTELDGAQDAIPAGEDSEADVAAKAREEAEDQPQDHSLPSEDAAPPGPDHQPTDPHAVSDMASSGVGAEEDAEDSKPEVDAETGEEAEDQGEARPSLEAGSAGEAREKSEDTQSSEVRETEGQASGMSEEDLAEASSEEEGGEEGGSEDGGLPSKEESGEDSGDGASSEEEGSTSGEAAEPQKTPRATGHEEEGAQLDVEDLSTGSEGVKTQDTEAEASGERQQGRGNPVIAHQGRN